MFRKVTLVSLVLFGFVLSVMAEVCFADASVELEQAKATVKNYITSGKDTEAADAYQMLINDFADNPKISSAVYDIAETYRHSAKFERSLQVYQDVVTKWPASSEAVWAQRGLAVSNIALDKMAEAQAELDKLKKDFSADPNIAEAVFNVADAYYWFSKYNEADSLYKYVAASYPDSDFAMWAQMGLAISSIAQNKDTDAEAAIQKLLTDYADNKKLTQALSYIKGRYNYDKKYEKARNIYKEAGDVYNKITLQFAQSQEAESAKLNIETIAILSFITADDNDAEAMVAIDRLVANFNEHPDLPWILVNTIAHQFYNKALATDANGLEEQAKACFRKAVEIWEQVTVNHPEHTLTADGYSWAGTCYHRLGKYEKSIECYQKVVENHPSDPMAWYALFMVGQSFEHLAEEKLLPSSEAEALAKAAYQQVLDDYPNCPEAEYATRWIKRYDSENEGNKK